MKKKLIHVSVWLMILTVTLSFLPGGALKPQAAVPYFEDVLVYGSGSDEGKVVITILGDGYTASQQNSFINTATTMANDIVNRYPYSLFKDNMNIHAIKVVSDVSGLSQGTYFQSSFGTYITPSAVGFQRMRELVAAYTPTAAAKIMVSNTNSYVACAFNSEQTVCMGAPATMFAAHEMGHALGQLSDEYTNANNRTENANSTQNNNSATARWRDFIGMNGIGLSLRNGNWYYPSENEGSCMMANGRNFCLVCSAALTERLADSAGIPFYGTLFNGVSSTENQKPLNTDGSIIVPEGTGWIADFAFHGLNQLRTLTIPADVNRIGEYAFLKCTGLTSITDHASLPQDISSGADRFYGVTRSNIILNIPAGTRDAYLAAGWTGFKEIREMGGGNTDAQIPSITLQPADITANIGTTAQLSVAAGVSQGTLSYQWYEVPNRSNTGGILISGATDSVYNAPADTAGTKYYYCIIVNTDLTVTGSQTSQKASGVAAVTVVDPALTHAELPVITAQPSDITVALDDTAVLSVTAGVSRGTLSYQWYETSGKAGKEGTPVAGAMQTSYHAPTGNGGTKYYYCIVTNTDDLATGTKTASAVSSTAAVMVNEDGGGSDGDTWDPDQIYLGGETVLYQGQTWRAKWWTMSPPGTDLSWELVSDSDEYIPGKAYVSGDIVLYQGQTWRAKWWTTSVPGSDAAWELV